MTSQDPVYLFLDFDGVLHPMFPSRSHSSWELEPFCYLPQFEAAVRNIACPVRIVISSSVRNRRSLDELKAIFSPDIADLVVGKTPAIGSGSGSGARALEVQAWLDTHAPGAMAVGIDDMAELYWGGETNSWTVVCCPDRFGPQQARDLVQACLDPVAWAASHPIVPPTGKIIIPTNHF